MGDETRYFALRHLDSNLIGADITDAYDKDTLEQFVQRGQAERIEPEPEPEKPKRSRRKKKAEPEAESED